MASYHQMPKTRIKLKESCNFSHLTNHYFVYGHVSCSSTQFPGGKSQWQGVVAFRNTAWNCDGLTWASAAYSWVQTQTSLDPVKEPHVEPKKTQIVSYRKIFGNISKMVIILTQVYIRVCECQPWLTNYGVGLDPACPFESFHNTDQKTESRGSCLWNAR